MSRFIGFGERTLADERKILDEYIRRKDKVRDKVDQAAGQLVELRSEVRELFTPLTENIGKQMEKLVDSEVKEDPAKLEAERPFHTAVLALAKTLLSDRVRLELKKKDYDDDPMANPNLTADEANVLTELSAMPIQEEIDFHTASLEYIEARLAFLKDPSNALKRARSESAEADLSNANDDFIVAYKNTQYLPLSKEDVSKKAGEIAAARSAAAQAAQAIQLANRPDIVKAWGMDFVIPASNESSTALVIISEGIRPGWNHTKPVSMSGPGGMYPAKTSSGQFRIYWVPYTEQDISNKSNSPLALYGPGDTSITFGNGKLGMFYTPNIPLDNKIVLMGLFGPPTPAQQSWLDFSYDDIRDYIYAYTQVFGAWQPQTDLGNNIPAGSLVEWITNHPDYVKIVDEVKYQFDPLNLSRTYQWGEEEYLTGRQKPGEGNPITAGLGMKKHPKGKPYRVGPNGQFGDLAIDIPALYNKSIIVATTPDGRRVMDERATLGLVNLLTKRVHKAMKDTYTPQAKKQFAKLVSLSGLEPPVKSKKFKMVQKVQTRKATKGKGCSDDDSPDVVVCGDMNDVVKRLHAATGMFDAGNRSKKNCMLITELATKLAEESLITPVQYRRMLSKYVPKSK